MTRKIVIIGHGPAGMTAAGFASRTDRDSHITVLNAGIHDIYHPCALPFVIGGQLRIEDIIEKARYQKISLLNNTSVTSIHPHKKKVIAVNEEGKELTFEYDALLIATGSTPLTPSASLKAGTKTACVC